MKVRIEADKKPERFMERLDKNNIGYEFKEQEKLKTPILMLDVGVTKMAVTQIRKDNQDYLIERLLVYKKQITDKGKEQKWKNHKKEK